jgi:hypothetical protein
MRDKLLLESAKQARRREARELVRGAIERGWIKPPEGFTIPPVSAFDRATERGGYFTSEPVIFSPPSASAFKRRAKRAKGKRA